MLTSYRQPDEIEMSFTSVFQVFSVYVTNRTHTHMLRPTYLPPPPHTHTTGHSAPVTTVVFAPVPGITVDQGLKEVGEMVVAADYQGCIKIYVSGEKL